MVFLCLLWMVKLLWFLSWSFVLVCGECYESEGGYWVSVCGFFSSSWWGSLFGIFFSFLGGVGNSLWFLCLVVVGWGGVGGSFVWVFGICSEFFNFLCFLSFLFFFFFIGWFCFILSFWCFVEGFGSCDGSGW